MKQLSGKECVIVARPTDTIGHVKLLLEHQEGVRSDEQCLILASTECLNSETLQDCNVTQVCRSYLKSDERPREQNNDTVLIGGAAGTFRSQ